jgi:hypothetical protein
MSTLADNAMLVVRALTRAKKDGLSFYELQQATRLAAYYICLSNKAGWFPRSSMALSRRSGFGTCANKLKRPLNFDTSLFHTLSRQATAALFLSPDFLSRKWCVRIASGDLRPPSPPAEKATARQDQPWKSCADDGGGGLPGIPASMRP